MAPLFACPSRILRRWLPCCVRFAANDWSCLRTRAAMLSLSPAIRIFVHALPTDMRKHFDGLSSIVTHSFGMDVLRGDYFVFINRSRNRCKILFWDRDGLVVWAKRLERG